MCHQEAELGSNMISQKQQLPMLEKRKFNIIP